MEGARHSAETQATATLLPTYVTEFQFMFFRMTNSPATFQTMMNDVFRTVIAEGIIVVYLDDILIFTKMKEEHEWAVQRVLEILMEHKLFLRLEKCEFHWKQIEYLGLVISENKVVIDPVKVTGVHK